MTGEKKTKTKRMCTSKHVYWMEWNNVNTFSNGLRMRKFNVDRETKKKSFWEWNWGGFGRKKTTILQIGVPSGVRGHWIMQPFQPARILPPHRRPLAAGAWCCRPSTWCAPPAYGSPSSCESVIQKGGGAIRTWNRNNDCGKKYSPRDMFLNIPKKEGEEEEKEKKKKEKEKEEEEE